MRYIVIILVCLLAFTAGCLEELDIPTKDEPAVFNADLVIELPKCAKGGACEVRIPAGSKIYFENFEE